MTRLSDSRPLAARCRSAKCRAWSQDMQVTVCNGVVLAAFPGHANCRSLGHQSNSLSTTGASSCSLLQCLHFDSQESYSTLAAKAEGPFLRTGLLLEIMAWHCVRSIHFSTLTCCLRVVSRFFSFESCLCPNTGSIVGFSRSTLPSARSWADQHT